MLHNLWQRLFSNFIRKYHVRHLFERNRSFKELHQTSYASEISKILSQNLIKASYVKPDQLLENLNSSKQGLSVEQVEKLREIYGLNELAHEKPLAWWQHLWYAFRNLFNILLTILALVAFFTGDIEGTTIITIMVVLSTLLRFWQESKSNKAATALKAMVSNTATVIRKLDWDEFDQNIIKNNLNQSFDQVELAIQELVPGDIILLSAGDMIRTEKIPFIQSRAAPALIIMTLIIMAIGIFLPMGPFAEYFKLQALPLTYFIYLPIILIAYMLLVQFMKKVYIRRYGW